MKFMLASTQTQANFQYDRIVGFPHISGTARSMERPLASIRHLKERDCPKSSSKCHRQQTLTRQGMLDVLEYYTENTASRDPPEKFMTLQEKKEGSFTGVSLLSYTCRFARRDQGAFGCHGSRTDRRLPSRLCRRRRPWWSDPLSPCLRRQRYVCISYACLMLDCPLLCLW